MKSVDFNSLPPAARKRLADTLNGEGNIETLAETNTTKSGLAILLALGGALAGAFALYVLYNADYAELDPFVKQGYVALVFYVLFLVPILFALVYTAKRLMMKGAYPFAPGVYLLPYQCVRAKGDKIQVLPRNEIINIKFSDLPDFVDIVDARGSLVITWKGVTQERFSFGDYELAQEAFQKLQRYSEIEHFAKVENDDSMLSELDPFHGMTDEDWAVATAGKASKKGDGPWARGVPMPLRLAAITALLLSMVAGPYVWHSRNVSSQKELFDRLNDRLTGRYAWEEYLQYADYEADKVREELLPAAAYREAYGIPGMREFIAAFPDAPAADEARARLAEAYDDIVVRMRTRLSDSPDPKIFPAVERVVRYLQREDTSTVWVRFRPPSSSSLSAADEALQSSEMAQVMGVTVMSIAPHFTDDNNQSRETSIAYELGYGFTRVFDDGLVDLKQGPRLDPTDKAGPPTEKFDKPTLVVEYSILASGELYTLDRSPQEAFVGIELIFDVYLVTPGTDDVEPLHLRFAVEPPEEFSVEYEVYDDGYGLTNDFGPSSSHVYSVMAQNAFDQMGTRLLQSFFDPAAALETESSKIDDTSPSLGDLMLTPQPPTFETLGFAVRLGIEWIEPR